MSRSRPLSVVVLVCALLTGCGWGVRDDTLPAAGTDTPPVVELFVEGPESVADAAEGVRRLDPRQLDAIARLVGLDAPGAPVRVLVLPESSPAALDAPGWVAGYADPSAGLVVLFPERSPSYPDADFQELVVHEIAHVLVSRAAAGGALPRWWQEGLATAAGGPGLDDRTRVTLALLFGDDRSLEALEAAFGSRDADRIARAYALAGELVRRTLTTGGPGTAARVLAAVAAGEDFDTAVARGAGIRLRTLENELWRPGGRWRQWLALLADATVLWTGIVVLAGWALVRRRRRAAAIRARWEQEDLDRVDREGF